jgi:polyisoprenoid-binding protein YceI
MRAWLWMGLLLPTLALAQDWKLDPARGRIAFTIKQMNVPMEGGFRRFSARAAFDPARPEAGSLRIEVDIAGIDTGTAEGDAEVRRPIWFDSARFPKAVFESRRITRLADGRLAAHGDLTVKGRARAITVPFTLTREGNGWLAEGGFPLKRSDFGIGAGEWNDVVADQADIRFRFLLTP